MSLASNIGNILEGAQSPIDREHYFKLLGVSENSTEEQITTEYRIRALKCHPDKNPGDENALKEFQQLQEARDVLTDPESRRNYDKWRHSEMCIPFKTWINMQGRVATTMHWAKPKAQTMIEGTCVPCDDEEDHTHSSKGSGGGIKVQTRSSWEPDSSSNVYSQFRNYKI